MSIIKEKYDSQAQSFVGGSTGDSDVGEQSTQMMCLQSQGSAFTKNPGEYAIKLEQALFEKLGSGG